MRLFFKTPINACSLTIGPRDALINRAVVFILSSSAAPTRPRVRSLNTKWIVRMSARSNRWSLDTRIAPAAVAASGVMFWLQAIRFIPKALPTRATCDPIRPSPRTPRVFRRRSVPTVCCQQTVGTDLRRKTLGVLGLGRIGSQVARVGSAFGMNLIAWSQNMTPEAATAAGAILVSKDQLFERADILTIHLVLSDRTRGLVGAAELDRMKTTARLINASRRPIVHEQALIGVLKNKRIAGAAIDVFDTQPLPAP